MLSILNTSRKKLCLNNTKKPLILIILPPHITYSQSQKASIFFFLDRTNKAFSTALLYNENIKYKNGKKKESHQP